MRNFSKPIATGSLTLALLMLGAPVVQATATITLKWEPAATPNVNGYRLYYGTSSGIYTEKLELGNTTTSFISNLTQGRTYYFVVTALTGNAESAPSNEISYTVPVSAAAPRGTGTSPGKRPPPPTGATPTPVPVPPAATPTATPRLRSVPPIVMPPSTLNSVRDMQEQPRRWSGSVQATFYARWCRGEP